MHIARRNLGQYVTDPNIDLIGALNSIDQAQLSNAPLQPEIGPPAPPGSFASPGGTITPAALQGETGSCLICLSVDPATGVCTSFDTSACAGTGTNGAATGTAVSSKTLLLWLGGGIAVVVLLVAAGGRRR